MKPVVIKKLLFPTKQLLIKRLDLNNHTGPNKAYIEWKMLKINDRTHLKYVLENNNVIRTIIQDFRVHFLLSENKNATVTGILHPEFIESQNTHLNGDQTCLHR